MTFTVTGLDKEIRIREYLTRRLGFSASIIGKVKWGGVRLNGEIVHMRAPISNGDRIDVDFPPEESENIEPIDLPVEIIYEDEYLIALNKPRNMPTHPSRGNSLPTLANALRSYIGKPFVFRAVNRLDRDTSGLVIVAKNQLSGAIMSRSMKSGGFQKTYYALIDGVPREREGDICAPIERESEGSIKRVVRKDGKESRTHYRVLYEIEGGCVCEVQPLTGRTHQIRVHLAHIGHPLRNDFLYGSRTDGETYRLHCGKIEFPHPEDSRIITLYADCDFYSAK